MRLDLDTAHISHLDLRTECRWESLSSRLKKIGKRNVIDTRYNFRKFIALGSHQEMKNKEGLACHLYALRYTYEPCKAPTIRLWRLNSVILETRSTMRNVTEELLSACIWKRREILYAAWWSQYEENSFAFKSPALPYRIWYTLRFRLTDSIWVSRRKMQYLEWGFAAWWNV